MFKAIIFDCFDVLVSNGIPIFINNYLADDLASQKSIFLLVESLNSGRIDYQTFLLKVSELSNVTLDETRRIMDNNVPDIKLFEYIRTVLKPNYKLAMLSNAGDDWLDEMIGNNRKSLFDEIILSFKVGFIKPQKEIYLLTANQLGVRPNECVMIDDKESYCKGARKTGMHAIQYKTLGQMTNDLNSLLSL